MKGKDIDRKNKKGGFFSRVKERADRRLNENNHNSVSDEFLEYEPEDLGNDYTDEIGTEESVSADNDTRSFSRKEMEIPEEKYQNTGFMDDEGYVYQGTEEEYLSEEESRQEKSAGEAIKGFFKDDETLTLEDRFSLSYVESKKRLNRSVKIVSGAITVFFAAIMLYMVYFNFMKSPTLQTDGGNRRMAEQRTKVIRGSFLDRNFRVITESQLNSDGSQTRLYHGQEAFGPVLGYVSDVYNVAGLESAMDANLSSDTSIKSFLNIDVLMDFLNGKDRLLNVSKTNGHSVVTTLDADLQKYAYELLAGRKGAVVAMVPSTGEILVMASSPGYNPADIDRIMEQVNTDSEMASKGMLLNRAVQGHYAPGSTFKVVTLASALQNIPDVQNKVFSDNGYIEFQDGSKLPNYGDNVYGDISLQEAFASSSNVVFGTLGMDLSNSQLKNTAEAFGFNRPIKTLGFSADSSVFPSHGDNEKGMKAQSAIGQGEVTATPLQMCMVASGVANDGKVMTPLIVSKIIDVNDVILSSYNPSLMYTALDPSLAGRVKEYMTNNTLYGTYSSLSSIDGGGKTGTAEFNTEEGLRVNAWFIGFAPKDNPQIAVAVVLEDLEDADESIGGRMALPIGQSIMESFIHR